jgi:hypothetical protein
MVEVLVESVTLFLVAPLLLLVLVMFLLEAE